MKLISIAIPGWLEFAWEVVGEDEEEEPGCKAAYGEDDEKEKAQPPEWVPFHDWLRLLS